MPIIRTEHQKNYVVISKDALENPRLSFKAKGLWAYCMSRPNDWEFHVNHLAKVSKDGEDAIYSAIKELEAEGYVQKIQPHENGRFGPVDYVISEIQKILPLPEKQLAGKQDAENPALLSIDKNEVLTSSPEGFSAFGPTFTEEEEEFFSLRMKEIPKPPKYISVNYKKKVIQGFRWAQKDREKHREEAMKQDGKRINGDLVTALKDRVEFTDGPSCIIVSYNMSDAEWQTKTKKWFKKDA